MPFCGPGLPQSRSAAFPASRRSPDCCVAVRSLSQTDIGIRITSAAQYMPHMKGLCTLPIGTREALSLMRHGSRPSNVLQKPKSHFLYNISLAAGSSMGGTKNRTPPPWQHILQDEHAFDRHRHPALRQAYARTRLLLLRLADSCMQLTAAKSPEWISRKVIWYSEQQAGIALKGVAQRSLYQIMQ